MYIYIYLYYIYYIVYTDYAGCHQQDSQCHADVAIPSAELSSLPGWQDKGAS